MLIQYESVKTTSANTPTSEIISAGLNGVSLRINSMMRNRLCKWCHNTPEKGSTARHGQPDHTTTVGGAAYIFGGGAPYIIFGGGAPYIFGGAAYIGIGTAPA